MARPTLRAGRPGPGWRISSRALAALPCCRRPPRQHRRAACRRASCHSRCTWPRKRVGQLGLAGQLGSAWRSCRIRLRPRPGDSSLSARVEKMGAFHADIGFALHYRATAAAPAAAGEARQGAGRRAQAIDTWPTTARGRRGSWGARRCGRYYWSTTHEGHRDRDLRAESQRRQRPDVSVSRTRQGIDVWRGLWTSGGRDAVAGVRRRGRKARRNLAQPAHQISSEGSPKLEWGVGPSVGFRPTTSRPRTRENPEPSGTLSPIGTTPTP